MAVTTITSQASPDAAEPPKRKHVATGNKPPGGARPGAGHPVTNGNSQKVPSEPAPLGDGSFWEWMDNLPREAWSQNLIAYVWRCGPLIDTGNGKPTSIAKLAQAFDVNFILENYGSGLYRFDVCETPPAPSQKGKCLRRAYEMVLDMRYPPKIPMGTWIDDTRNSSWAWCKPDLEAEAASRSAQPQQQNSLIDALDVVAKMKEITGGNADPGMAAVVLQLLQNSQEALRDYQDPAKQVATIKSLMDMAGGGQKQDSGLALMIEMMREQNRELRADIRAMREQQTGDPLKTSLDTLKSVAETLQGLGMNLNPGTSRRGHDNEIASTIGDVLTKVIDKGSEVLPVIVEGYKYGKDRDLQMAMHGQQQQQNKPWAYDPSKPQAVAPVAAAPTPTAPAPSNQPMTPVTLFSKYGALIQSVGQILVDHFQNLSGGEFREWLIERKGLDLWNTFRADVTPELLTEAVTSHPQLKAIFTPPERALEFFQDMLDEDDEDGQGDEDTPLEKTNVV